MSYHQECQALANQIQQLMLERSNLRKREQDLKSRARALPNEMRAGGPQGTVEELAALLRKTLPYYLYPGNVGQLEKVAWPFYYTYNFDFGTDPTYTVESQRQQRIEISQEAAFIAMAVSVDYGDNSPASFRAPVTLRMVDTQSSRQLNDRNVPIQTFGRYSNPTVMNTGFLVMPNSSLTLNLETNVPEGFQVPTVGDGSFQVVVSGVRVRVDAFRNVLSTVTQEGVAL